jgi:hypothetical protein
MAARAAFLRAGLGLINGICHIDESWPEHRLPKPVWPSSGQAFVCLPLFHQ